MCLLRLLEISDAEALADYFSRNREFHHPWTPLRPEEFFSVDFQRDLLAASLEKRAPETEFRFGLFSEADERHCIGSINLFSIERRAFQNGRLGYSVCAREGGRGLMSRFLPRVVEFAFLGAQLHRVEANVMPRNTASIRVIEKCGLQKIGFAPRMVKICGAWEDHLMYAMTLEEFAAMPASPYPGDIPGSPAKPV